MNSGAWPAIDQLVPHTAPMILIDRLVAVHADGLDAEVTVRRDSPFAGADGVPAWVGIEYMAQTIAAWGGWCDWSQGQAPRIGYLVGTRRYQAARPAFTVGQILRIDVREALRGDNGLSVFACEIRDDAFSSPTLASSTLTVYQPPRVAVPAQDYRHELTRP